MTEYRCSQCGQKYSHNKYMALDSVSRVTDDPNDKYGVETVCECGERFHSDKWTIVDEIEVVDEEFEVSTVALTIPHGMNRDQWYETCIFFDGGSRVTDRYTTQEEAEEGHRERIQALENDHFEFVPTGRSLEFE